MLGHDVWWDLFRKHVIIFGNLFNDLKVRRVNAAGTVKQTIPVPIEYAERDKMIARITANPDLTQPAAIILPRVSFEITGWEYEPDRNLGNLTSRRQEYDTRGNILSHYSPMPVAISFQLNVWAKFAYDAFQIVEQIVPFFKPEWSVSAKLVPGMNQMDNVRTVLRSVTKNDDATQGAIDQRRTINWTLTFTMHTHFVGPVRNEGLIKRVNIDFWIAPGSGDVTAQDMADARIGSRYVLTPGLTANGMPTSDPEQTVPYSEIGPNDDFGLIEEWTDGTTGEIAYIPRSYIVTTDRDGAATSYIITGPKTYIPTTGGPVSGYLSLHDDPTQNTHPVTLHYLAENAAPRELVKVQQVTASTSTLNINLDQGGYVILNLDTNVTTLNITGWDAGIVARCTLDIRYGGPFEIAWGSVLWPSETGDPPMTSEAGRKDVIMLYTPDQGTTIFGSVAGLDYQ